MQFTEEERAVLIRAAALQLAYERIVGTDRTLPVNIEAACAAKNTAIERLVQSADEAGITIDVSKGLGHIIEEAQRVMDEGVVPPESMPSTYVSELQRRAAEAINERLYEVVPDVRRLREEKALLEIARDEAQGNYDQMLKDKPRAYVALHGLLTLSRTLRAAAYARWADLLEGQRPSPPAERARAAAMIERRLGRPLG